MNLQEAEAFFKSYYGSTYLMDAESHAVYDAYEELGVSVEQEDLWRAELANDLLSKMMGDPDNAGSRVAAVVDVVGDMRTGFVDPMKALADKLEWMLTCNALNHRQRILVLEAMAGSGREDGGIRLAMKAPMLRDRYKRLVVALADFNCEPSDSGNDPGWTNASARYDNAVAACRLAFKRFA
jgi:hypothetical protein